jgi:serine/threonine-protein kinase RsbW
MKKRSEHSILATVEPGQFVGRSQEFDRLTTFARASDPSGLDLLCAPGAGASELLKQVFDGLFREDDGVVPFYFSLKRSERDPGETARRFLLEFLTQTVAYRRQDPSIIDSAPDLHELAQLAPPADGLWIDRLVEATHGKGDADDDRSFVRSLLSAPARAVANGVNVFAMIDDLERSALLPNGDQFVTDLRETFDRAGVNFVLAGARRFMFGVSPAGSMSLGPLDFQEAGKVVENLAAAYELKINDQTRDLMAVQFNGNLRHMRSFFSAAVERGKDLGTFRSVEDVYKDEIFGGRISRSIDADFQLVVPESHRVGVLSLMFDVFGSSGGRMPAASWQRHLGIGEAEFRALMNRLNMFEFVTMQSGDVQAEKTNHILSDYIRGRFRLEVASDSRALVIGEALTDYLKRAPQLLGRLYRRNLAIGLRDLLASFNTQEIPAASLEYAKFKAGLKGLSETEIAAELESTKDKITLPQIVYAANTSDFYPKIGEIIDDERSSIALGFEQKGYHEETVWIAAEIDSKLEANRDLAEFWCDRLEMAALSCGFEKYKLWLIAPEGFDDGALAVLGNRNAYGSSRRQAEILTRILTGNDPKVVEDRSNEYEIVVPMGGDTEMIAAHAVEDIARKHNYAPKAINQIKTALVEACINATEHSLSPDRRIYQKFVVDDEKITVTVANRGIRLLDRSVHEVVPSEGRRGWGLKLMKGLMDDVRIEQSDDGTRVTMVKYNKASQS